MKMTTWKRENSTKIYGKHLSLYYGLTFVVETKKIIKIAYASFYNYKRFTLRSSRSEISTKKKCLEIEGCHIYVR